MTEEFDFNVEMYRTKGLLIMTQGPDTIIMNTKEVEEVIARMRKFSKLPSKLF